MTFRSFVFLSFILAERKDELTIIIVFRSFVMSLRNNGYKCLLVMSPSETGRKSLIIVISQ